MALDLRELQETLRLLKNADPRVYDKFSQLLDTYVTEITVAVIEATTEEILVAKGRAQQARKFLQLFTEFREPNKPTP